MNPLFQLHNLVERIGSLFRASLRETASRHTLKLVQLEALIYLALANRYSDTPAALGHYLEITKGTISQTLKALEQRELINKQADPADGRVVHCRPSDRGLQIVAEAYPAELLRPLDPAAAESACSALAALLTTLQRLSGGRSFGQCRSCRFFQLGEAAAAAEEPTMHARCGLTGEWLSKTEADKLCREHEPAKPGG